MTRTKEKRGLANHEIVTLAVFLAGGDSRCWRRNCQVLSRHFEVSTAGIQGQWRGAVPWDETPASKRCLRGRAMRSAAHRWRTIQFRPGDGMKSATSSKGLGDIARSPISHPRNAGKLAGLSHYQLLGVFGMRPDIVRKESGQQPEHDRKGSECNRRDCFDHREVSRCDQPSDQKIYQGSSGEHPDKYDEDHQWKWNRI